MKTSIKPDEKFCQNFFPRVSEENLELLPFDYVREWCEVTTSHGFSNIVKSKSWISKIIWILFVFAGITYCFISISFFFVFLIL